MRYFKWGVSRFLLEPNIQPLFVPMFIDGPDQIMHESRKFPRFLPRIGKKVKVVYGTPVPDDRFRDVRGEWAALAAKHGIGKGEGKEQVTVEDIEELRIGKEAVELRIETTKRVRDEIVKLRRSLGYLEEEEGAGDVETYKQGGMAKRKGKLPDGAWETDVV
jgi:monolysocardiolipin acyltransferase